MAFNDEQKEYPLPGDGNERRKSVQHLPRYFRSEVNKKFLSATFDQLNQPGQAEKLNGYFGRKTAKGYNLNDNYIGDVSQAREDYQLEPVTVVKDDLENVEFYGDYNDFINQINNLGGSVSDHSLLNRQEYYAYDPHINWDKFVNFREYYWLPNGPQPVGIFGRSSNVITEYSISSTNNLDNYSFAFQTENGITTNNPELVLYRGLTYKFSINTPGLPFSIKTKRSSDNNFLYNEGISDQAVEDGVLEITLSSQSPDFLFYVSDSDLNAAGLIKVYDSEEATSLNVEDEILGKKTYTTEGGFSLSNGMKVFFQGNVTPEKYADGFWYVEGVGESITLISDNDLNVPTAFTDDEDIGFDEEAFDRVPFSTALGFPEDKDYITINRAAKDGNLWSKYNRWFHRSVIEESERINKNEIVVDQFQRAARPIIEFEPGLRLYNFGTQSKTAVNLVDDFTADAFSTIEGSLGYNIDGVDLANGMRILLTAETDQRVNGKIYEVRFFTFVNTRQISLIEVDDTEPLEGETVLVTQGNQYRGKVLWYNGTTWEIAQGKTQVNQSPLFEVYDSNGRAYGDQTYYGSTTFVGNAIFSYMIGAGNNDSELGFPLSYRNIENVGDIVFKSNLQQGSFTYQENNNVFTQSTSVGFLRKYYDRNTFDYLNSWKKSQELSYQPVIRQYEVDNTRINYPIDVYKQSGLLTDLWIRVYLNNALQFENIDYIVTNDEQDRAVINFINDLDIGDIIRIKTKSSAIKNENGFYEIPPNFERNPLNQDINEFTLGEVNDHVGTIVEEIENFSGEYPGTSNLRDLGGQTALGKRIIKNSGPVNLSLYNLVDRDANVINALKYARREYGKFKRLFLQTATDLSFDGTVKDHVDRILREISKDKTNTMPFYFSDMLGFTAFKKNTYEVENPDGVFFALTQAFDITIPSSKAVNIYQNNTQLLHDIDYTFNDQGFAVITTEKQLGDIIDIYEYETTNGSFIPPTPTKLGLYPKYQPVKYTDDTYLTSQEVIQGHDGSVMIAFGDYRDDLILELEQRIFNNIKVAYDTDMFDIYDYVPSETRNTGLSQQQIDDGYISDFVRWLQLVDADYTLNDSFERLDPFTFNYNNTGSINDSFLTGTWRALYKFAYDTDRPHTHPWEMLGFSIKPTWWETEYGPAPYTSNNLLMWEDIENGVIREPGQPFRVNEKFKRNNLTSALPVDESGNLLDPLTSGYIKDFNTSEISKRFVYGDHSPVETTWRKSAEYPFALITSIILNQPNRTFATIFDRIRQVRDLVGNIVYEPTQKQIKLDDLVFPNNTEEEDRVFVSGLLSYIVDYLASKVSVPYNNYKESLINVQNQLGFKIGGFTNKDKFRLILDSRSPLNQGNVFVPDENYQIFLNSSTPTELISYSGVIIEKQPEGFVIRGYNQEFPYFNYHRVFELNNDPFVNVGGISENFVIWDTQKTYIAGTVVEFENSYYRVQTNHTSTADFEQDKFVKLPELPVVGGRSAYFRRQFSPNTSVLPYGTVLETIQEVIDFLLGYSNYLEKQGFVFDYYDKDNEFLADWKTSAKEFMFWTTQNWGAGAVIALSPAALQLKFVRDYSIVDNVFDTFYGYSILKADGKKLVPEYTRMTRENPNEFVIRPKNTADGIFAIKLPLVQKEHAVLLDNTTVFNDIIYDLQPGYRQERIKILGYRTDGWDGSLNIPGFIYDDARVTEWSPWTDYAIGDVVKYKEFYYSAQNKISGSKTFNADEWYRLPEKPEPRLLPNWDYKAVQFADFYDLDTDNFDVEQQKFAQHLIGYQNRQYLENIINDDVSQYKFYQGLIQDKGSQNALTKLFDALGSADKDSLDFYEEWAIKTGHYGASAGFEEVEYLLDESQFRTNPQPVLLVDNLDNKTTDLIYRILPYETYLRPNDYDHSPFPSVFIDTPYVKDSGYVNQEDAEFVVADFDSIVNIDYQSCRTGANIWVGNEGLTWNIYNHINTDIIVERVEPGTEFVLVLNSTPDIKAGEIIGVYDVIDIERIADGSTTLSAESIQASDLQNTEKALALGSFFKVKDVILNRIIIESNEPVSEIDRCIGKITRLSSVRATNLIDANQKLQSVHSNLNTIWVDDDSNGRWRVIQRQDAYALQQRVLNTAQTPDVNFAKDISVAQNNNTLVVGSPNDSNGLVYVYTRPTNSANFSLVQTIEPSENICDVEERFGYSVEISKDGEFIIIGSPEASNVKTQYQGTYQQTQDYNEFDIVERNNLLWRAQTNIEGAEASIQFGSFASVTEILIENNLALPVSEEIPVLLTGNYPFENLQGSNRPTHFLVRAPLDMYEGSTSGDELVLEWNQLTNANQELTNLQVKEPFNNEIAGLSRSIIETTHTIGKKVDVIMYVENSNNIPDIGDVVEIEGATGVVNYTYNQSAQLTLYLTNVNGSFGFFGSISTSIGEFVGEYVVVGPTENTNLEDVLGGYWFIDVPAYEVGETLTDTAKGLVYKDLKTQIEGLANHGYYYNIFDTNNTAFSSEDTLNSYVRTLTYAGSPGPAATPGGDGVNATFSSPLWVIRAPKDLTDAVSAGDSIDVFFNSMIRFPLGVWETGVTYQVGDIVTYTDPENPDVPYYICIQTHLSALNFDDEKFDPLTELPFDDITSIGLTLDDVNKKHTIYDVWDGYIKFDFTTSFIRTSDKKEIRLEPRVGQQIRDKKNGATAFVTFVQKFDDFSGILYVKNINGNWPAGQDYGDNADLEMLRIPGGVPGDSDGIYLADQPFGQIQSKSLGLDSEGIGKLLVFEKDENIQLQIQDTIIDAEYWFYNEDSGVDGIARAANIPSENNNDWQQVYNIPTSANGSSSGLTNEGMYSVFTKVGPGRYTKLNSYVVPDRKSNNYLGNKIRISKINNLYKATIHARGQQNISEPGKIYVIKNGVENNIQYNWEIGVDKEYRGEFDSSTNYFTNDIVYLDNSLYRANTNIAPGTFNSDDWSLIENIRSYNAILPAENTSLVVKDSDIQGLSFDNAILDQDQLEIFGRDFDVSNNGEVLVVSLRYFEEKKDGIAIYRNYNGQYLRYQTLTAPSETIDYGASVAVCNDGLMIAVGAPKGEIDTNNEGLVYIYRQNNGEFVLSQILESADEQANENFGIALDFDGSTLAVGARNSSSSIETIIDANETTFDNGFTKLKSYKQGVGIVRLYQKINDLLVYGQSLDYDDTTESGHGEVIHIEGNHVYVGMPNIRQDNTNPQEGFVIDYKKNTDDVIVKNVRLPKDTVDLDKIKRVILYDTKENELLTYLDYIDVFQGKVAGPAEQEISYKTYYDPAVYSNGTGVKVDSTRAWSAEQTGKVWWDLTNAKFLNPYQDNVIFSANNWNTLFQSNTVDVYEWVETEYTPAEWDNLADTEQGISEGVSGTSKYGNNGYSTRRVYDEASGTFTTYYYFWVKNKVTLPPIESRDISVKDVADLIADPAGEGYKFVTFVSSDSFVLHNCKNFIKDKDVAISVQYWTIEDQKINIHNQYQILTDGLEESRPNRDIEQKWFDSLIGFDSADRAVPAPELSAKEKYGILNRPRQSWFVNRTEALKQFIDRVNDVLLQNLIVDDKNIVNLTQTDPAPTINSRRYDIAVDNFIDLQFVGVARARRAVLNPVVENGRIIRVEITDAGRGYIDPSFDAETDTIRKGPNVEILGNGTGAIITTTINNLGSIISVSIDESGENYDDNTTLLVRRFTALVRTDENVAGKWSLYERIIETSTWNRTESQAYDVSLYWNYTDWYDTDYNEYITIDYLIDEAYELQTLNDNIGDVVKISNVGTGGWLLLEKIDEQQGVDYTVNYKTVGRQNGTIQFASSLYDVTESGVGFDSLSYDIKFFNGLPTTETRIVLETIRDELLVDELAVEYNKLFFASLRYVFAEQNYVDWAFKTSFVKAQHNVGQLEQKINFQNDNLPSYESYLEEVKPYKTKLREYVSSYEKVENSQSMITDFDLPPIYNETLEKISPQYATIDNGVLVTRNADIVNYPSKHWADNLGFEVIRIELADAGQGYQQAPQVSITGGAGSGATAVASLGRNGSISQINIVNSGSGYLSLPTVSLNGSVADGGREATPVAVIGNSRIRSTHMVVKFDRVSGEFEFTNLFTEETFIGSGVQFNFDLEWPMDLRTTRVAVFVNNIEVLGGNYTYENVLDVSKGYDRYKGRIIFVNPPASGNSITIQYYKSINLLHAQDRINLSYTPRSGEFGKDLAQLMDGIDYGGVEVKSFDFTASEGWDADAWFTGTWDTYDTTYTDERFETDGSTTSFTLSNGIAEGETWNVYLNGVRIDDPNWDGSSLTYLADDGSTVLALGNPNAIMPSITIDSDFYDADTYTIHIPNVSQFEELQTNTFNPPANNIVIFRKSTSDGSFLPDPNDFDTIVEGGNLAYSTATGILAEDINVDGDGFVTPTTSKGPEEFVPGQVLDTVDIQVYERPLGGTSIITCNNYLGDGSTTSFNLNRHVFKDANLFVKIGYNIIDSTEYAVNYTANTITFDIAPAAGERISISNFSETGEEILGVDNFIGDGETLEFLTNVRWNDTIEHLVTVDGVITETVIIESDEAYEYPGNVLIRFGVAPATGANIRILLVQGLFTKSKVSQVTIDEIVADGSTTQFELSQAPFTQQPLHSNTLVTVNDVVLTTGYSEEFDVTNIREYQLRLDQVPVGTKFIYDLEVFLNGVLLEHVDDYLYEGAGSSVEGGAPDEQPGSTIRLRPGVGTTGDKLTVYIITEGEYLFGYLDSGNEFIKTPDTIYFDSAFNDGDIIKIYQFSNHNIQDIDRQQYTVLQKTELSVGTENYYKYNILTRGLLELRTPAEDAQYVWVSKNGNLLNPNFDYSVTDNKRYVKLVDTPTESDVYDIIHFSGLKFVESFAWRQFKDITNKTVYKRFNTTYKLAQDLNWYDTEIVLENASGLPQPSVDSQKPSVLFLDGERIEYFIKDENTLRQIRRGTLGTGIKDVYPSGTFVMDQNSVTNLPYKDQSDIVQVTASGYSEGIATYGNSSDMSIESISYDFNNNTAFPLGGQVCTVTGTGFTDRIKVLVGETECSSTFISSTELTFITPALSVGSYDLIVINEATNIPVETPRTSAVLEGAIKYVQILLPFAPLPATEVVENPASRGAWYRKDFNDDGIPDDYWEALDIEVFVGGRRLRKSPTTIYNYDAQDSPEGDIQLQAEFAVNKNVGEYVRLTEPPPKGARITVVRKIGKIWSDPGTPLGQSDSQIAGFLRSNVADLPR